MSGDTVDVGADSDALAEFRDENEVEDFELFEDAADDMEFDEFGFEPDEPGPNTREAFEDEEEWEEDEMLWEEE